MINGVIRIECDTCYDYGVVFYGNGEDYDIEPCQCVKVE